MFNEKEKVFNFEYDGIVYYYNRLRKADQIKVERDSENKLRFLGRFNCSRCGSRGESTWNRDNGVCYECRGKGYTEIILNTTKKLSTAERRVQAKFDKKQNEQGEWYNKLIENNILITKSTYSDSFYLILDSKTRSTYKDREYLKNYNARWNPLWRCWWIKFYDDAKIDFTGFKLILIRTKDVLNDYNKIDDEKIHAIVYEYNLILEQLKDKDTAFVEVN